MYDTLDNENELATRIAREANIKLASLDQTSEEGLKVLNNFNTLLRIAEIINFNYFNHKEIAANINDLYTLILGKPLSPLTFDDNEFYLDDSDVIDGDKFEVYFNKRYDQIRKEVYQGIAIYIHISPYIGYVKSAYDHNHNKEFVPAPDWTMTGKVYITKGGVVTGEYISYCTIDINRSKDIDLFTSVKLGVSVIQDVINDFNTNHIYTVDARDPMLKVLRSKYIVITEVDESIKGTYDIRKYTKLNK